MNYDLLINVIPEGFVRAVVYDPACPVRIFMSSSRLAIYYELMETFAEEEVLVHHERKNLTKGNLP